MKQITLPDGSIGEFPADMSDDAIRDVLRKKFPPGKPMAAEAPATWAEVPARALENLPSSALKFATDLVQPILQPVETVKGIANIGYGLASKAAGALGVTQDPDEKAADEAAVNAVGKHFSDRYGSLDGVKKTLATDPVGVAGDLSLALTGGGAAAARAPGLIGQVGQVARTAGTTIDPLNIAGAAARGVGNVAAHGAGLLTGTGAMPFQTAYQAGRSGNPALVEHMRGTRPLDEVVDMAERGVRGMTADRRAAYSADMAATRANPTPLDLTPVGAAYRTAGDKLHFQGIVKSPEGMRVHADIGRLIADFQALPPVARTAEAFDALKQAIGEIRQGTQQGTIARTVADEVYNAVKSEITRQSPTYANAMRNYADASDAINEVRRTLSVNDRATTDTTLRKLQSITRNNVQANYGQRQRLGEQIAAREPDFMPALAGQALNSLAPRGLARIPAGAGALTAYANPLSLAMLPLTSPRIMGEAAHAMGAAARVPESVALSFGLSPDTVRRRAQQAYHGANAARLADPDDDPSLGLFGVVRPDRPAPFNPFR